MFKIFLVTILFLYGVNDIVARFIAVLGITALPPFTLIVEGLLVLYAFIKITKLRLLKNLSILDILFILGLVISLISGFINRTYSQYSIMSFYIFLMPIIMMKYGRSVYQSYGDTITFEKTLKVPMYISLVFMLIQASIYGYINYMGYIGRVGNSIAIVIPLLYLSIYTRNKLFIFLIPIATILQAKRIAVLSIFGVALDQIIRRRLFSLRKFSLYPIYLLGFMLLGFSLYTTEILTYLQRWETGITGFNSDDLFNSLDVISAGRIEQIVSGWNLVTTSVFNQLIGPGSGSIVTYIVSDEQSWYVHNTFLTYAIQCGLILPILIFSILFRKLLLIRKSQERANSFAYIYILYYLPAFFLSANIAINPLFWFFLGGAATSTLPTKNQESY